MYQNVMPVNRERHAGKKIKEISGFGFASKFHIAYVTMHEFVKAAAIYPIVFIEDKEHDLFRPVALLGLDAGENVFVDNSGKWDASYIPAIIRRYPFALSPTGQDKQFLVCIDEDSPLISDTEGSPLFTDNGEPTQVIENVKRYLLELQQMDAMTQDFTRFLAEHNMLTPLSMRVRQNDRIKNISGCYVINEERLGNLSGERFLEIRAKHYLPAIYAQLMSLAQIERLAKLKDETKAGSAGEKEMPALTAEKSRGKPH